MSEADCIEFADRGHSVRLYIAHGVPENVTLQPHTRGEIKDVQWHSLAALPTLLVKSDVMECVW